MNIKTIILAITFGVISVLHVGCGGGGGGSDGGTPGGSSGTDINGGITGHLFMGASGDGELLDLSTGEYTVIPGVDWSQTIDNEFHPRANYYAMPSRDGEEFIVTITNCFAGEDPLSPFEDCIFIHDKDGTVKSSGKLIEDIEPTTRFSVDKAYFAFFYNDDRYSGNSDELIIFDSNFQFISRSSLPDTLARSFDWLPNGQIVYIHDQTFYITPPYDTNGTPVRTFPSEQGRPDYIAASPDGKKVAFTLVTYLNMTRINGATWVMNVDGTDPHQLAYIPNNDDPIMNYPTWSPDGKYIMNMVGYIAQDGMVENGILGGLYAIPASSRNVALNDDGNDGIVHIRSYFHSNSLNYDFASSGNLVWIP